MDIATRTPVWCALSNLFLDTDTSSFRLSNASILAHSPYSINEIEAILGCEVYPVCKYNLMYVAGEWAGFDEDWLVEKISKPRGILSRWWNMNMARIHIISSNEWICTKEEVQTIRNDA